MQKFLRVDKKRRYLYSDFALNFFRFKVNFLSGIYILFDLKEFNNPKNPDAHFNNMLIKKYARQTS